jgi:hypothetical protein
MQFYGKRNILLIFDIFRFNLQKILDFIILKESLDVLCQRLDIDDYDTDDAVLYAMLRQKANLLMEVLFRICVTNTFSSQK